MAGWRWFGRLHGAIYRASGGRIGANLAGIRMLLLTTRGRKSGLERTLPLAWYADGEAMVIVASNAGQERPPAWLLNLQASPEATVQLGGDVFRARAEIASPRDRARLWPVIVRANPIYGRYEKKTSREIPLVRLVRIP